MNRRRSLCVLPAMAVFPQAVAPQARPVLRFGVVADVQYADKQQAGRRDYRASLPKLEACVDALNAQDLAFVIQLGDLIDGGEENLGPVLAAYNRLRAPARHVLGNHDFATARPALLERLGMKRAYYDFGLRGWRFVVLDGMDLSVTGGWPPGSPNFEQARTLLGGLKAGGASNAYDWNGGIGDRQKRWLKETMARAEAGRERVIVFSHFPILREASTAAHLLWNHEEVLALVESSRAAAAFLNGHDHSGGYAQRNGIHHVTLEGMVEAGARSAYAVVEVYGDRLVIHGTGAVKSRVLPLTR